MHCLLRVVVFFLHGASGEEHRRRGLDLYREGLDNPSILRSSLALFEAAVAANPLSAMNHAYLGNVRFRLGQNAAAEESYQKAIALDPALAARYHSNLGSLYAHQEMYATAAEYFREAKRLDPTDGTLARNYDSAEMLWRLEQMVAALRGEGNYYNLTGFLDGSNYSQRVEVALEHVASQFADLDVVGMLQQAHDKRPGYAILSHLLANGLQRSGRTERAAEALRASLPKARRSETRTDNINVDTVHVVCVASSHRVELDRLRASLARTGMRLVVLGAGKTWRGLGSKISLLTEYIADKPDDDLLLFLDAYDVLALPSAANLPSMFAALRRPDVVVFGAETNCAPDPAARLLYPPSPTPFRYLNSGTYVGAAAAVRTMLRDVAADVEASHVSFGADPYRFDDQRWFTRFALAHPGRVLLDTNASFFHTLHDVHPSDFDLAKTGQLRSRLVPGARPAFIHGNGNGIDTFHALSDVLAAEAGWPLAARGPATTSSLPP